MVSKFERKFGRFAIKNLTLYLIIGYAIGYIFYMFNPLVYSLFSLDPYLVLQGQVWRIITWIFTIPQELGIFTIIMLFLYYSLGSTLERVWGTYRYNVYLFSGFLFTIIGAFIVYGVFAGLGVGGNIPAEKVGQVIGVLVSTYYINMSIFLAFATTFPDMQLMLYFIIPVKIKWFGFLYTALIAYDIYSAFYYYHTWEAIIVTTVIATSLLNFIIYFLTGRKNIKVSPAQWKRRREFEKAKNNTKDRAYNTNSYSRGVGHKCVICGRTDETNPELTFRYCSKCSGNKEYCQEHLFTHEHK